MGAVVRVGANERVTAGKTAGVEAAISFVLGAAACGCFVGMDASGSWADPVRESSSLLASLSFGAAAGKEVLLAARLRGCAVVLTGVLFFAAGLTSSTREKRRIAPVLGRATGLDARVDFSVLAELLMLACSVVSRAA